MRLAVSSWAYAWQIGVPGYFPEKPLDAFGLLDKASELGVDCVQIADNLPLHALAESQMAELIARAGELAIEIEVGTRGLTLENLDRYLRIAQRCRSPILRMVIDQRDYRPDERQIVSIIKDIRTELKERAVVLALENHDRFTARSFARIAQRAASDRVGICLDTTNSFGAGEGIEAALDTLAPLAVNLHVKDFSVRRVSHNMGFVIEGTPAGQGMLPIPGILGRLASFGRCTSAVLEQWPPPEKDIDQTIRKEERWARESIAYLRPLIAP